MKSNNKKTAKDIQKLNEVPEKANKAKNELDRNVISTKTKQIRDETN